MISYEQAMRWVAELESGNWKQAKTVLYNPQEGSYCCLGVLACGVLGFEAKEQFSVPTEGKIINPGDYWGEYFTELPGEIIPVNFQQYLMDLNDDQNVPFPDIAKHIRKNLYRIVEEDIYCPQHDLFNCWACVSESKRVGIPESQTT